MSLERNRNDYVLGFRSTFVGVPAAMPQINGVTTLGEQLGVSVGQATCSSIALWFPRPFVEALKYKKVGELILCQSDATRQINIEIWDVIYPGIWPVFNVTQQTVGAQFRLTCFRPGLAYSLFWG